MKFLAVPHRKAVATQDAVKRGIGVATAASSKATHYHTGDDQLAAIRDTVEILDKIGGELPLVVAAQPGAAGVFIQQVIAHDLSRANKSTPLIIDQGDWGDARNYAVDYLIEKLKDDAGLPYMMRLFTDIKARRINNRRTVSLIVHNLLSLRNVEFAAVKYRSKMADALQHAWGASTTNKIVSTIQGHLSSGTSTGSGFDLLDQNISRYTHRSLDYLEPIILYVFGKCELSYAPKAKYPVIHNALLAKRDIFNKPNVPSEVLFGLVSRPAHPQYEEFWSTKEKRAATTKTIMDGTKVDTENKKARESTRRAAVGTTSVAKIEEVTDALALAKMFLNDATPPNMALAYFEQIDKLASKYAKPLPFSKVGVIIDSSRSMDGDSKESNRTPAAIALLTGAAIRNSIENPEHYYVEYTGQNTTDLATAFVRLLRQDRDIEALFVISDGYENAYDGALEDVVSAWKRNYANIPVFHLSPIGSAEMGGAVRSLGGSIVSQPANWKAIDAAINSNLFESNFTGWLQAEVTRMIGSRATE